MSATRASYKAVNQVNDDAFSMVPIKTILGQFQTPEWFLASMLSSQSIARE